MAEEKKAAGAQGAGGKRKLPKGRHLSALKRHRQSLKRATHNRPIRSEVRLIAKKVMEAVQKKDKEGAKTLLKEAMSVFYKAAAKKILHSKTSSRHIARLSASVARLGN